MIKRLEQIDMIVNEILTDPTVDYRTVANAAKLAAEDTYLYNLMIDYAKETESYWKAQLLDEMLNYTEEKLRNANL